MRFSFTNFIKFVLLKVKFKEKQVPVQSGVTQEKDNPDSGFPILLPQA